MYHHDTTSRLSLKQLSKGQSRIILEDYKKKLIYKYAIVDDNHIDITNDDMIFHLGSYHHQTKNFIGYVNGYFPIPNNILWIQTFIIDEPFLRQGYGTEFYQEIINQFSVRTEIAQVYLSCLKENLLGIKFWESLGFKITATKSKLLPNTTVPSEFYIYSKELKM